jgi:NADH:ubiquinone oxidoreductase subunit C
VYITIDPADWPALCRYLYEKLQARFIIASGLDTPGSGIEILYHFDFHLLPQVLSVRVFLKKPDPEIESVSGIFKAAEWIEREIQELLGVRFKNHPNPTHLLLPEDWPKGNFPLRRDQ